MNKTPLADVIERMIELGEPKERIIMAVKAMEIALAAFYAAKPYSNAGENRRAWDRRRKAKLPTNWSLVCAYVFKRDGYICTYCGDEPKILHCDHIIPLSRGGLNEFDNLTAACPGCNLDKGSKLLSEWQQ